MTLPKRRNNQGNHLSHKKFVIYRTVGSACILLTFTGEGRWVNQENKNKSVFC